MPEFFINKTSQGWNKNQSLEAYRDSLEPGRYKITIVSTKKRSLNQNAWFHSVLPDILRGLRDAGYNEVKDVNDAKNVVKSLFFKKKVTNGTETIDVIEGTSDQSKIDFVSKAGDIIQWAAEYLNIDVAPPEKQLELLK